MALSSKPTDLRESLVRDLRDARARTDEIFALLRPEALWMRPVAERHRLVFYLGHLEAFDWNLLGRDALGRESKNAAFDRLFAFGIDPVGDALPSDSPGDWPAPSAIEAYGHAQRDAVDELIAKAPLGDPARPLLTGGFAIELAIEHRLMHAETLSYLLHQLPYEVRRPEPTAHALPAPPTLPRIVDIPEGTSTLGRRRAAADGFGWDNEFSDLPIAVPAFRIDAHPVTNGQYLAFVEAGGYTSRSLWSDADWAWRMETETSHPRFWRRAGKGFRYRAISAEIPLQRDWPVYVSHAEASAYARFVGKSLPTEAEWHRAAYGTPGGSERAYPWGNDAPGPRYGAFDFNRWDPTPVGAHPAGASAFGVADLVGNGWEWTSTVFAPFPGFEPAACYPGYSADFFDGKHYVLKGGSTRTAARLLRRSFRNWFQPHYPYVYASFRCVSHD